MSAEFGAAPVVGGTERGMPLKFKVLIGMYALSIMTTAVELYLTPGFLKGCTLLVTVFILVSLIRGNEAMRQFVMVFAVIGLAISGVALVLSCLASLASLTAIVSMALSAYGVVRSGFVLWCLRQQDVQFWMYEKSMKQAQLD